MKHLRYSLIVFGISGLLIACGGGDAKKEEQGKEAKKPAAPQITLTKVANSPEYPDSKLKLVSPTGGEKLATGDINFDFDVEGTYELGSQTIDADVKGCANSKQGHHIHMIVDNNPYTAHYNSEFTRPITREGNHIVLAFLSRSYHESIKTPDAYVLTQLTVGDVEAEKADLSGQHMFYSRPKGTYKGKDTKKVLLDFYLVNTTLAPDGNKVKATINGNEFIIDEWVPHFIEGLPMGETNIQLQLIDKEGKEIPGPYNTVNRTITLEKGAEAKQQPAPKKGKEGEKTGEK